MVMKSGVTGLLVAGILSLLASSHAQADTAVFVIPVHGDGETIDKYIVEPNNALKKDATYLGGPAGAVGLAFDQRLGRVLETAEESGEIRVFNTSTQAIDDTITIATASDLSGIAADNNRQMVYVADRELHALYVLRWNWVTNKYGFDSGPHTLSEVSTIYGIAVDSTRSKLYVADETHIVRCYSIPGLSHDPAGDANLTLPAVGIAVDGSRGYIYTGYMDEYLPGSTYLTQYDIINHHVSGAVNVGSVVMGVAVDEATGIVDLTTFAGGDPSPMFRYGPNLVKVGDPCGVELPQPSAIAAGNTKSDILSVSLLDGIVTGGCAQAGAQMIYTVVVDPNNFTHNGVVIGLAVPQGVTVTNQGTATLNGDTGFYVWSIGTLHSTDPAVTRTLTVAINTNITPGATLTAIATAESDISFSTARRDTDICCIGGQTIYVRANQDPCHPQDGLSWSTAFKSLSTALSYAGTACQKTVWVAQGTYKPGGSDPANSFVVSANVKVYGGFIGTEPATFNLSQRNLDLTKTVLDGTISETQRNNWVVTMGNNSLLNGFVVEGGGLYGIYGYNTDFAVEKCQVLQNVVNGIYCEKGSPTIKWCSVTDSGNEGVYAQSPSSPGKTLTVVNSRIMRNGKTGIYSFCCVPTIKSSVISGNGFFYAFWGGEKFCGIKIDSPATRPLIRNCTIVDNSYYGVEGPLDMATATEVRNCILWANNPQTIGVYADQYLPHMLVYYSCIMGQTNDPNHCINSPPQLAYSDPNMPVGWHLLPTSPCIDKGDPCLSYTGESDIDGQIRVYYGTVDMGADEVTCDDVTNVRDWNHDGAVDIAELGIFVNAWLSPGSPTTQWDSRANLYNTDTLIDLKDFAQFAAAWRWHACWRTQPPVWPVLENSEEPNMPFDPNRPADPNLPTDPNLPVDPNQPTDPNDPNSYGNVSMQSNSMSLRMNSIQIYDPALEVQQLQDNIDFLYEAAAAEDPNTAADMYEFIGTLEQELSDIYGTLPGYDFTQ
jgi:hypothetical protein